MSSLLTATQKQNNTIRGGASFTAVERARLILIGQGSQPNRPGKAEGDETSAKRAAKSKAYKEKLLKQAKLDEEGLRNLRERFSSGPTAELSTIFGAINLWLIDLPVIHQKSSKAATKVARKIVRTVVTRKVAKRTAAKAIATRMTAPLHRP